MSEVDWEKHHDMDHSILAGQVDISLSVGDIGLSVGGSCLTKWLSSLSRQFLRLEAELEKKANKEQVCIDLDKILSQLEKKAEKAAVEAELAKKADEKQVQNDLTTKVGGDFVASEIGKSVLALEAKMNSALEMKAEMLYVRAEFDKRPEKEYVDSQLKEKASTEYVVSELEKRPHKEHVDIELATKVHKDTMDVQLKRKADSEHVDAELAKRAHKEHMDAIVIELAAKVARTDMEEEFAKKADKVSVDAELTRLDMIKADKAEVAARAAFVDAELLKKTGKDEMEARAAYVDAELAKKTGKEEMAARAAHVDAELAKKTGKEEMAARAAQVDAELAKKTGKAEMAARAAQVDAELAKKTGKDFLNAQLAGLSETAKQTYQAIEGALKEQIAFEACSAELTKASKKMVGKVAEVLKKHPDMSICVEGHTGCKCGQGNCTAVKLSNSRSESVVLALKEFGCQNKLLPKGHGCRYRVGMAVKIFPARGQ